MKVARIALAVIIAFAALIFITAKNVNNFQDSGTMVLPGLDADVRVVRDEKGMPYIYAETMRDAIYAQGFVVSQDRLFQMELLRRLAKGEISQMLGEKARDTDIQHRTIGFYRNAVRHVALLNEDTRNFLQSYVDGINEFIRRGEDLHLEFRLAGVRPQEWTVADALAVGYFTGWNSAANFKAEIVAQMILEKIGPEKARRLVMTGSSPETSVIGKDSIMPSFKNDPLLMGFVKADPGPLAVGSNNWVLSPKRSAGGMAVVVNDPHLQTDIIPGPWYPLGIITPGLRAVGVALPGLPGIIIGRTGDVAWGVTNSYHDAQDLYVETIDPSDETRYLEGGRKIPFTVIREDLVIKDKDAPGGFRKESLVIRSTRRGPVISGAIPSLKSSHVVSLRWSPFETMAPTLGLDDLLKAKNAPEMRKAISRITVIMLNYVFADKSGAIGWMTSGRIPLRVRGDGSMPLPVTDGSDNWRGFIPLDLMPQAMNPSEGWIATANNKMVPDNYPVFISSFFAPQHRYNRIRDLISSGSEKKTVEDHWQFMRDDKNLMAERLAPILGKILVKHEETKKMGDILLKWDFRDDKDSSAPMIFQALYRRFAILVFRDELGDDLAMEYLATWYLWQDRLESMVLTGSSPWFDDVSTVEKESMDNLIHRAATDVLAEIGKSQGNDPADWTWGEAHRLTFVSPIMRKGPLAGIFGGGSHPMSGSGETVYRGRYKFEAPFDAQVTASLRMVIDLADPDKIAAVLPGGPGGRVFEPSTTVQVDAFMNGDLAYWWFSDREIEKHTASTLMLKKK